MLPPRHPQRRQRARIAMALPLGADSSYVARCQNAVETMTQKEMLERLAKDAKLSRGQAKSAFDSIVTMVSKTLKKNGTLRIAGLGTFNVQKRGARTGRNPRTGEPVKIKASKTVRFKVSQTLKGSL
jgi:DNA-binding protein HU-beta